MLKNSNKERQLSERIRAQSAENEEKMKIYNLSNEISQEKERHFLQVYCGDLAYSKKAFDNKN